MSEFLPQYNLHPLIVHFPIALLTTYAFLEIVSFGRLRPILFYSKAILVILGGLALLVAKEFGEIARDMILNPDILTIAAKHELFAKITIGIFGILAIGYTLKVIQIYFDKRLSRGLNKIIYGIQYWITSSPLTKLLALAGLVCLTITGALGGSMVYGSTNDPVTNYIYHFFFQ